MGSGVSISDKDDPASVALKIKSISPAYADYAERVELAGLSGAIINTFSENDSKVESALSELGVETELHRMVLKASLHQKPAALVMAGAGVVGAGVIPGVVGAGSLSALQPTFAIFRKSRCGGKLYRKTLERHD